ncbi:D-alanyl-D-alanine carboxypeptidase/D-alanyl-D-alanine-endopeptidase [Kibdelosporangium philippinense]|uniref:D-alanyl-D-alanine carboxypeptidase/D-alanyl-D-alanine-endopeptidase n=1 Tax=Kibdelosporangium philippinense TaxID=211113 RepID=A0ABS8ZBR4_9PSEU|nr:D-alanyl-D-alanine carboxypeptidase/D-alanyl-D-alanine-endopeptidase [Kibdelosporangium philippinense]MCE7004468.1 D-alanyl-D-alanine carboxypeptidase/D-alanyl-D-alanine-endopeptidase [Kibdelosporangium philippinense]
MSKRMLVGCGVAIAAVALAGLPASGSAQAGTRLVTDLNALVHDPSLQGASVGLVVRKADTGEVLYTNEGTARRQPGSGIKLLTSAAALEILGPDYRFTTSVLKQGDDLYIKGTGDPTVLAANLDDLAAKVAASGTTTVPGKLIADDTWFDSTPLGVGWAWDDEPYYYSAETSALTIASNTDYDAGTAVVSVMPGAPGKAAVVWSDPANTYLTFENATITRGPGLPNTISVERKHGTNVIRVSGFISTGAATTRALTTVKEPTGYVAALFREALKRKGVEVVGPTATRVATPANATLIAEHKSMPLSQMLTPMMKLSNNMHSEALVKAAGRAVAGQGTWDAGLAAMTQRLSGLGVQGPTYLGDGSGLSRFNQVAPDQMTSLLRTVRSKPWFNTWYNSLPIAGVSDRMVGGTLRSRMTGTAAANNLRGKTGTLTGVSGLSGYVTSADGQPLVFSMLSNNFIGSAKAIEDQVGVRLAKYRADEPAEAPNARASVVSTPDLPTNVECSWVKAC